MIYADKSANYFCLRKDRHLYMNINQSESANNSTPKNYKQSSSNRLKLLIPSFCVAVLAGYFGWREFQLNAVEQSVHNCIESQTNCSDSLFALEKLVKAKKSLRFFNLENADLENAHLKNANLQSTNLEKAHLEHAHLENVHLKNANLSMANMNGAHLDDADLENVNLSHANLENAILYRANLQGAHIFHDKLQGADLDYANLQGTSFYNADFKNAYFHLANLSHTYFYRANFDRANLYRANLKGAHLIEAQNLTPKQIKSACNWKTAVYKGVWSSKEGKWVVDKQANAQFIQQLKHDKKSNSLQKIDCSQWD